MFLIFLLVLGIGFALLVSMLLQKHGSFFLSHIFPKSPDGVKALTALLNIGFYLINFGYVLLMISFGPSSFQDTTETVKFVMQFVGFQCLLVGVLHVINMALFSLRINPKK